MNMKGPEEKGGTPLSSTGSPGVALLTAAKTVRDLVLGAIPAKLRSDGPQGSVRAVHGGLVVFGYVPSYPEAVGVHHPAPHLFGRVALHQQRVLRFED
jgi:hypothetical protein